MQYSKITLSLALSFAATTFASAIARAPAGIEYTTISPADIPEFLKVATNVTTRDVGSSELAKRADYGVYLCTDAYWGGYCVHIVAPENVCVPLAGDLNDQVSSVGPDAGAYCRFFWDAGCTDDNGYHHFDLTSPGYYDLSVQGTSNDQITSYQCWST